MVVLCQLCPPSVVRKMRVAALLDCGMATHACEGVRASMTLSGVREYPGGVTSFQCIPPSDVWSTAFPARAHPVVASIMRSDENGPTCPDGFPDPPVRLWWAWFNTKMSAPTRSAATRPEASVPKRRRHTLPLEIAVGPLTGFIEPGPDRSGASLAWKRRCWTRAR